MLPWNLVKSGGLSMDKVKVPPFRPAFKVRLSRWTAILIRGTRYSSCLSLSRGFRFLRVELFRETNHIFPQRRHVILLIPQNLPSLASGCSLFPGTSPHVLLALCVFLLQTRKILRNCHQFHLSRVRSYVFSHLHDPGGRNLFLTNWMKRKW